MKQIEDIGPIKVTDVYGNQVPEQVTDSSGHPVIETVDGQKRYKTKPAVATLKNLCLSMCVLPQYVGELKGIEAAVFIMESRKTFGGWKEGPGSKLLENDQHKGLLRVLKEHDFGAAVAHSLVPHLQAIADAKDVSLALAGEPKAKVLPAKKTNGKTATA